MTSMHSPLCTSSAGTVPAARYTNHGSLAGHLQIPMGAIIWSLCTCSTQSTQLHGLLAHNSAAVVVYLQARPVCMWHRASPICKLEGLQSTFTCTAGQTSSCKGSRALQRSPVEDLRCQQALGSLHGSLPGAPAATDQRCRHVSKLEHHEWGSVTRSSWSVQRRAVTKLEVKC